MEQLVSFGQEVVQNVMEHLASYRLGQSVLRQIDRVLWVVEKCARWAVPLPLDQDERPQPELVRPLPWAFFLMMLIALRLMRETISLANLVMGKPPLRSADVVMFIQTKRRYLRTLKYQGSRMMRARTSTQPQQLWYSGLMSLFELTMCFRRQSQNYGNNNTTRVTNNDEVMVIKRYKQGRQEETAIVASLRETEATMERLIEKMMVDIEAESDEDSSYTLANASSPKSDLSEYTEADQDTICQTSPPTQPRDTEISTTNGDDIHFSPNKNENSSSTPEKTVIKANHTKANDTNHQKFKISEITDTDKTNSENSLSKEADENCKLDENITESAYSGKSVSENINSVNLNSERPDENSKLEENVTESAFTENSVSENINSINLNSQSPATCEDSALPPPEEEKQITPKQETEHFLKNEITANVQRTPKKDQKIVNGRTVKSVHSKKKVNSHRETRPSNEAHRQRTLPSHSSF